MIGLMVLDLEISKYILVIAPAAIIINVLARSFGVSVSSLLTGKKHIPGNYNVPEYVALMTWSALKGGLSLALAIGTQEFLAPEIYVVFMDVTYITIFFTVLVQGLTVGKLYFALEKHKSDRMMSKRKNA